MQWMRKAADSGVAIACDKLAVDMYADNPYAREAGLVGEAARVAAWAGGMEGHDVPPDVIISVVHWLRKGGHNNILARLEAIRREALQGATYCWNDGCEVMGFLKDFKVCPQCKTTRYCGAACQKQDWTTGGHKATCGNLHTHK